LKGKELTPRIGIFGRRNYGKSSLVNYLTGQDIAIVSDLAGTTTDPVRKTMEITGIGPVVWIDTAGIDDEGTVGRQRIERSLQMLAQCDLALILFTNNRFDAEEVSLVDDCRRRNIPFILIYSQADKLSPDSDLLARIEEDYNTRVFPLTVKDASRREPLIELIRKTLPETSYRQKSLLGDVIAAGDTVVLVTPIDSSAPEGRMILPQVQVLRDLLDNHARAIFCQPAELAGTLASLKTPPRLVITDSQAFHTVRDTLDDTQLLTSFSVVLARAKGLFEEYVQGTPAIDRLQDGDRVLMLESCTHNVTCEDIGRVKLPALLAKYTGKQLQCETLGGLSPIPDDIKDYALVIQCGGCVITRQQLASRLQPALDAGVPVSNYGLAIAYMNGIFHRSLQIFREK
jgi:[FeFe] hydrogenase H-cluster maturation GTPase HydF